MISSIIIHLTAAVRCGLMGMLSLVGPVVPASFCPALCDMLLRLLGVSYVRPSGIHNTKNFKGLIVFNHPTFYDHFVIMAALKKPISFVYNADNFRYMLPIKVMLDRLRCIPVSKNGGTTELIKRELSEDRMYPIAIAPSVGHITDKLDTIVPFRSGAFYASDVVLPIVLVYTSNSDYGFHGSMLTWIWKRMTGHDIKCILQVLEPMERHSEESIEAFRDRVYSNMCRYTSSIMYCKLSNIDNVTQHLGKMD